MGGYQSLITAISGLTVRFYWDYISSAKTPSPQRLAGARRCGPFFRIARRVVLLSDQAFGLENVKEVALGCGGVLNDIYRVFPYIVYAQLFALLTSLKVENKPDTPSPTGTVNRVVQGVIIHEYQK